MLLTNEVWVILQLEDLHTLTCLVLPDEVQASGLQAVNVHGIDLVPVTVSLLNFEAATVQCTNLGPVAPFLEDRLPGPKTHGASHVLLVELGH